MRDVAEQAGLDYSTCIRWIERGSDPRRLYKEKILAVHPDFPC